MQNIFKIIQKDVARIEKSCTFAPAKHEGETMIMKEV